MNCEVFTISSEERRLTEQLGTVPCLELLGTFHFSQGHFNRRDTRGVDLAEPGPFACTKDHAVPKEILHRGPYPDGHPAQPVRNEGRCGTGALPASLLAQHDPGSHLSIDPDAVPQPPQPPGGRSWPASQECGLGWVLHSTEAAGLGPLSGQTTGRKTCLFPYQSMWYEGMEL